MSFITLSGWAGSSSARPSFFPPPQFQFRCATYMLINIDFTEASRSSAFSRRLKDCLISWVRGKTTANAANVQLNLAAKYCCAHSGPASQGQGVTAGRGLNLVVCEQRTWSPNSYRLKNTVAMTAEAMATADSKLLRHLELSQTGGQMSMIGHTK